MNRCQFCSAPSTIHLTDVQEGQVRTMHLCDRCGREHDLIPDSPQPQVNLQSLLHLLLAQMLREEPSGKVTALTCPHCKLNYQQFRKIGRFGCPADYDIFQRVLCGLLDRIHRSLRHSGKTPKRWNRCNRQAVLRERLAAAVAAEDYQLAAKIRDELKDLAHE